jgi:hypothetical protein
MSKIDPLMAEAATCGVPPQIASATAKSSVIYLAEAFRTRRKRRSGMCDSGSDAEACCASWLCVVRCSPAMLVSHAPGQAY